MDFQYYSPFAFCIHEDITKFCNTKAPSALRERIISALAEFCKNAFLAMLNCILFTYFLYCRLESDIIYKLLHTAVGLLADVM